MININNKEIGKLIKKLREDRHMSQGKLADELFVDRTLVNKWENGHTSLTSQNLVALSEYFKISTDELLSGKLITSDNIEEIKNVKLKIYDESQRLKKRLKIFFYIIAILIVSFLSYFFFTFYNSVSMYRIYTKDDLNLYINNGVLIKMKDYIIFKLDIDSNYNIDTSRIYYKSKQEERTIIKSDNNAIFIIDYYDSQEYFDFKNFNKIINNMYIEITLSDNKTLKKKLNMYKTYVNNRIVLKNKNEFIKDKNIFYDITNEKFTLLVEKYKGKAFEVKIKKLLYNIYINENFITIDYKDNDKLNTLIYTFNNSYLTYVKDNKNIYIYSLINNKCNDGNCSNTKNDILLVNEIINKMLKDKKNK